MEGGRFGRRSRYLWRVVIFLGRNQECLQYVM
jgi:hypothetical protein